MFINTHKGLQEKLQTGLVDMHLFDVLVRTYLLGIHPDSGHYWQDTVTDKRHFGGNFKIKTLGENKIVPMENSYDAKFPDIIGQIISKNKYFISDIYPYRIIEWYKIGEDIKTVSLCMDTHDNIANILPITWEKKSRAYHD